MSNEILPPTRRHHEPPSTYLPEPPTAPQLLWPSIEFGREIRNKDIFFFPGRSDVYHRRLAHRNGRKLGLVAFEKAVNAAMRHILVLDPHFDNIGANALELGLIGSQASDIRLLTGPVQKAKELLRRKLTEAINLDRDSGLLVEVQWAPTLDRRSFPFLHDRFAIVDGSLWHFGSTVGGGHPSLTAASGPWSASQTRAKEFFEECWRECNAR